MAQIGAAHGVRGEVRLQSFTEEPAAFAAYGPLESADRKRVITILGIRSAKDHFIARIEGVDDRDAAEALRNTRLYAARDRLPPTGDDETFYHADLIGLAAVTQDGELFGTIAAIYNFGAGDVIEIARPDEEPLLVAFTAQAVPSIDLAAGRVVIVPPEMSE